MPEFQFVVTVLTDTAEHAQIALNARLDYDEEIPPEDGGPFDYEFTKTVGPYVHAEMPSPAGGHSALPGTERPGREWECACCGSWVADGQPCPHGTTQTMYDEVGREMLKRREVAT